MNQLLTFLAVTCFTAQDPVTGGGPDAFGDQLPVGAIIRLGTTRMRITAESVAVTISSDSKILATADSRHSVIRLWDVSSGWHLKDLADPGSSQSYIRLEFSRDSRNLILKQAKAPWNLRENFSENTKTLGFLGWYMECKESPSPQTRRVFE